MSPDDAAFLAAFDSLPRGTFRADFNGKRWLVSRSGFASGLSEKLVGNAVDESDYISMNLYRLSGGIRLAPCEMQLRKVREFVLGVRPYTG